MFSYIAVDMSEQEAHEESDLGLEQRQRLRREGEAPESEHVEPVAADQEPDLEELEATEADLAGIPEEELVETTPELAEDLRRAQPNPPMVARQVEDPDEDVDLGPMEDREGERDGEELRRPVELSTVDELEAEREERGRPGQRS